MERIGIIGYGFVGKACDYGFNVDDNQILAYDKFKQQNRQNHSTVPGRMTPLVSLEETVRESEYLFVCLPTPFHENEMRIDLEIMDRNMHDITRFTDGTDKVVIVKSTVVPGTTRRYQREHPRTHFCFNPEFLTEKNYLEDFVSTDRIVIGADNNQVSRRVNDLYRSRFPHTKVWLTDTESAETVKYMANCALAVKVMVANEFYDFCQACGLNYDEIAEMVGDDTRIGHSHLKVTSARGFGGKCFPKDMAAMIGRMREIDVDASVLEAVWSKNLRIRKVRDWEEIPFAMTSGKKE